MVVKQAPLCRQLVEVRSDYRFLAITAKLGPEIIDGDEKHIRPARFRSNKRQDNERGT